MTRAGWYGAPGRRRQRWWCTPRQGLPHRFAEPLPRLVATGGAVHTCPECQTLLEPWEGKPAPRLYGFAVADVAWALAQAAGGGTYRDIADRVRSRAGRPLSRSATKTTVVSGKKVKTVHRPAPNTHPQMVSDWVEVFAPVLWAAYAPATWPNSSVVLDADPVTYTRKRGGPGIAFHTLAVMAYNDAGRPYVAAVEAVARDDRAAWRKLLMSKHGAPLRVVTDGDAAELNAVAYSWRWAETWRCEWHLKKNLSDPFPAWLREDPAHPMWASLAMAQTSPRAWASYKRRLNSLARTHDGLVGAVAVMKRLDPIISVQAASRPRPEDGEPLSTGAVERFLDSTGKALIGRAATMTNKKRADALLTLFAMAHNGWVDERRWADILTEKLLGHAGVHQRGRPSRRQRTVTDDRTAPSLPKS
ncbi:hypothetical protein [Cellulomonas alba]|uniref:Mutator family transposase n=1 Tax=Cellulomonas alba TaxID=3053467 RepID=A0ABT7SGQ7_9CELL|nr:hypothetical protein [Cellulomonas alba]MDM7854732.1 hypothetical protein [Cellulomonas alba]